jgi:hypothetical protein
MARTFGSYSPVVPVATTWEETIEFADENDAPVDLTGFVVEAQLRATPTGASVLNLTTAGGHWTMPDPTNGTILLKVTPEVIAALLSANQIRRDLLWAVVLRDPTDSNLRLPLVKGRVSLRREAAQYSNATTLAP